MSTEILIIVCIASLFVGAFAGIGSGLFGLGGGIIVVPSLLLIFKIIDLPSHSLVHLAIGTSVSATTFSTIASVIKHAGRGGVVKRTAMILAPTVVVTAAIGASVAHVISDVVIELIFGCILAVLGVKYLVERHKEVHHDHPHHPLFFLLVGGACIGFLSGLMGVGGGFFVVPLLLFLDTPFRKAVGTASVTSFSITFVTAICYFFYGMNPKAISPYTYSLIFIPSAIAVAIGAVITAPYGVKIARHAPVNIIKRIFGVVLIAAGVSMIINGS
jgi:uncharacterized protein